MKLWIYWWNIVRQFRHCFSREQTFLWFVLVLIGFSVRQDIAGVTSIIRCLGLNDFYYDRILDFFHSSAIKLNDLSSQWLKIVLKLNLHYKVNGRMIILGDGIKISKEGKKMPAVKSLHQDSDSNSKPEYIMGHSCQALTLLMTSCSYFFSLPLICRIHEGITESNRDTRTQMDKMISMLNSLNIVEPFYLVADAYYANRKIVLGLLKSGQHLITRVKKNAVAYMTVPSSGKVGRPKLYGDKICLNEILKQVGLMSQATVDVYNEGATKILYRHLDLLWKPVGCVVRFVFVVHPTKGSAVFMSTDISLEPLEIIKIYSLRFKIEVSFKQAVHTIGTYAYHFWMMTMDKIKRKSGGQYIHKKDENYREQVKKKMNAYHVYIQVGLIAQGLLQILSMTSSELVWKYFGSWIRTIRPGILPSEAIVMNALRNTLPEFLKGTTSDANIEKFILSKLDLGRTEGQRMVA